MDLSKAIGTLDYHILLKKFSYYGIEGPALDWFSSYLTGRQQYVELDGVSSSFSQLSMGVPQGSILGPLLFLIYLNDIPNASNLFKYVLYTDDTTLFSTINISAGATHEIKNQISKVYDWLAVNKLSLNVNKTKYTVFHAINKNIEGVIPELIINGIIIERVQNFNFLGIFFNANMLWKTHNDIVANKLIHYSGVLNKLKRFLPSYILSTLYFSMVQSRLTYGILAWGFVYQRFVKLQIRFMRIITLSTYNAHTEPLFKNLEILTNKNLFDLNCLKFVYNYDKGELPNHFLNFKCVSRAFIHNHETRFASLIDSELTRTVMAQKCMRHHLITVLNCTPSCILDKIGTHSWPGFIFYIKRYYMDQLSNECNLRQCYVCYRWKYPYTALTQFCIK